MTTTTEHEPEFLTLPATGRRTPKKATHAVQRLNTKSSGQRNKWVTAYYIGWLADADEAAVIDELLKRQRITEREVRRSKVRVVRV